MRNLTQWHPATLRHHRDLTPTVREFELRPEGGVRPWTVGSHLKVQVRVNGVPETRSYSLVGLHDAEVYRIAVKRAEPGRGGSRHLWSLETGAELLIGEPNNHFELPHGAPYESRHYALLAGGIGITPLVGMALWLAQRGASVQMAYAARDAGEFAFGHGLRSALGDRLRTFDASAGEQLDLPGLIAALPPRSLLLTCGPLGLLDAVRHAWAAAGRPPADLRFETFGNSGAQPNQAFRVRVPRHGIDVDVPADRSLLDVLQAAGVETLADCQRGECGLCAMDVLGVEGAIDHRDVFFSPAQKQANDRLCACVSRVCAAPGREAVLVLDSAYRTD